MSAGQDELWTEGRTAALDARLDPALTSQRDAFSGGRRKLSYLEGHTVIAQLNRLFGYGAWSYSVDEMGTDEYTEGPTEGWYLQCWAVVTLRVGGVSRQDVGCVEVQNTGKGGSVRDNVHNVDSRSTARKGAVTDALKRAARTFGQQLGNGLYDTDDNIYAWMAAHGLDATIEEGQPARAPERRQEAHDEAGVLSFTERAAASLEASGEATAAQPAAQEDPLAQVRAEVTQMLAADAAALERLQTRGTLPADMSAEQLGKTKRWLAERAERNMPASARLAEGIEDARSPEQLRVVQQQIQRAKDERTITHAEYVSLLRHSETRRQSLGAGPLTAAGGAQHGRGEPGERSAAERSRGSAGRSERSPSARSEGAR